MEKSAIKIIFSRLIEISIFLLFWGLLNFSRRYLEWDLFVSTINFLNSNAFLLVLAGIIFMFAELLSRMEFPSNLFGPILSFTGTWMLLYFIFNFSGAINRKLNFDFLEKIILIRRPIIIAILSIVFLFGYLPIIYKLIREKDKKETTLIEVKKNPLEVKKEKVVQKVVEKIVVPQLLDEKKINKNIPKKKKNGVKKND